MECGAIKTVWCYQGSAAPGGASERGHVIVGRYPLSA